MRPTDSTVARRPYLVACPSCGENNGVSALACWKCEQPLTTDRLHGAAGGNDERAAAKELPVLHAEAPAEVIEEMRAAMLPHHGEPHTLPPLAVAAADATANDARFAAPRGSNERRWLVLAGVVFALLGGVIGAMLDRFIALPTARGVAAQSAGQAGATRVPAVSAAPALKQVADVPAIASHGADAPSLPNRAEPRAPPSDVEATAPPVDAPCTPQIAALALCTLNPR